MRFDFASGDLQLVWNTFLDFEAFTREADGDLNYFIEEWKEKMVRVQSAGCQYSDLLLGLKLMEKVNLSSDSIISIISKLGSSHSNSDSFLAQVVTNLKAESGFAGSSDDGHELEMKSNLVSCSYCPFKFFDAVSLSKHYQDVHPIECDKNFYLKEDLEEHQNNNDDDVPLESFVQVLFGSPESSAENQKYDPLMPDEIKMEINSVIDFESDINTTKHHKKEMSKQGETQSEAVTESSLKSGTANRQIKTLDKSEGIEKECIENAPTDDNLSFFSDNKVPCKTCGKVIAQTSMSRHKRLHRNEVFKCWICQKEFKLPQYLKEHLETHKETKDHICPYCSNAYQTKENLKKHLKKSCRKNLAKTDNNLRFEDKFQVEKVMRSLSKDITNTETEKISDKNPCEIEGENIEQVVQQKRINLKNKQGETQAELSLKSGTTNRQINTLDISEGISKEGNESIPTDDNLSFSPDDKVPCKTCGKLIVKTRMFWHKRLHRNEVFTCFICQKEFKLAQYLKSHLESHKKTKDHICPYCSNAFQTKDNLRGHMKKVCRKKLESSDNNSNAEKKFPIEKVKKSFYENTKNTDTEEISGKNPFQMSVENVEQVVKQKNNNLKYKQGETQSEAVTVSSLKFGTTNIQTNTLDKIEGIKKENIDNTPTDDNLSFSPENKVRCKTCGKFFAKTSISKHKRLHMNNALKCWICQKEFKLPQYLKDHLETHKETRDHICSYCGNAYKTRFILRRHLKKCCRKKLAETDNNPHTQNKFQIGKVIKSLSEDTMNRDNEEISGKYPSEIAGENMEKVVKQKETSDQSLMDGEGKIHCEICKKLICRKQITNHIKVHRPSVQCQCEICGEVVEDRKMRKHLKTHNHQRNYKCSICHKKFKSSGHLKQHIETHNATKEYICSFCGKKYKTKMTLYIHINQHTKGRPLPCQFCNKIFYCYGARTFHIRAHHTGEKPYKCDICDERFYISARKVQHMRKHTGEKPFSCEECGKNYSEAASLRKHMRTVHKEVKLSDI